MPATAVKLEESAQARLEALAARRKIGLEALLNEAVDQFLEREQAHSDFRDAAFKAWADYQATGLHATAAEADEWLERLERGEDAAPPSCHG